MEKKVLTLIGSICLVFVLAALPFMAACPAPAEEEEGPPAEEEEPTPTLPDVISCSSYDIAGAGYVQASVIAGAIDRNCGMRMRVIPVGTGVGRFSLLATGQVDACWGGLDAVNFPMEGVYEYAGREWGPQPLQAIYHIECAGGSVIACAADANMKTPYDLKGKRIAIPVGSSTFENIWDATLAFANLTWDDVIRIDCSSYSDSVQAIIDGRADCNISTGLSTGLYNVEACPRGLSYISFPASDNEGWARMQKVAPYFIPVKTSEAIGMEEGESLEGRTYHYPIAVCYPTLDDEIVYQMVKAIVEQFDSYKNANAMMPAYQLDKAIVFDACPVPYHEGAIRYFKEVGLWNSEWEERNNMLLERQTTLADAWEKAIVEADASGMSAKEFPAFWMDKRAAALEAAGF